MKRVLTNILIVFFLALANETVFAQQEISAVQPANGAANVNVGILKWNAQEGLAYDLYFGLDVNPALYKENLTVMEEKPVILELNKTYFWKIVEKKEDKVVRTSKIFKFSTLPISLNPSKEYKPFVDLRDYKVYWTINVNGNEWFAQNLDYDLKEMSWYYEPAKPTNLRMLI